MKNKRKKKDNLATVYFFRLKDLEKKLGKERRKRKSTESELEKANRKIKEMGDKIKELEEENEGLKECRKTYAKMLFKGKTQQIKSPRRGRKKGHQGISRKKPDENRINNEIDVTLSCCPKCGDNLNGCKRKYEHIIEDIMINPQVEVNKYWIHQYVCGNCGEKTSAKSKNIIGQSAFGRKTFAAVLFYRYRLKTSLEKIAEALEEIHGLKISKSGVQNLLYQASIQFGKKYEQLKQLLISGQLVYADETGWRVNGESWWTWLWSNDEIVIYTTENTRGKGIPEKMLAGFKGLLNRDGYTGYNKSTNEQQICWVHMLRKAHEYCGRTKVSEEMILLKDTLKTCYRRMTRWHRKKHDRIARKKYHDKMKTLMKSLSNRKWKEKDTKTFNEYWLVRHEERLVTFLKYSYARPENNHAERAIRPMVIFRKITGGSKSARGIKATDINMSILETWKKQNYSLIQQMPIFGLSL